MILDYILLDVIIKIIKKGEINEENNITFHTNYIWDTVICN